MYEIFLEKRAQRDLRRLEDQLFRRVIRAIRALSGEPRPQGCRKIVGSDRDWRIRVGDYRIIYEIDDESTVIRIMFIRHRREAYR